MSLPEPGGPGGPYRQPAPAPPPKRPGRSPTWLVPFAVVGLAISAATAWKLARGRFDRVLVGPPLPSELTPTQGDLVARTLPGATSAIALGPDGTLYFAASSSGDDPGEGAVLEAGAGEGGPASAEAGAPRMPDGAVFRRAASGGAPEKIASGFRRPRRIRATAQALYVMDVDGARRFDGDGSITRIDLATHGATRLVVGQPELRDFVVDGAHLTWLAAGHSGEPGVVRRIPLGGGAVEELAGGLVNGEGMAEDGAVLFWMDNGKGVPFGLGSTVYRDGVIYALDTAKRGETPRKIARGIQQPTGYLVAGGGTIDFETRGFGGDSGGGIFQVSERGGEPTRAAPHQFVIEETLALQGDALFWASYEPGKPGGPPEDLERATIWTADRKRLGHATAIATLYAPAVSLTPRALAVTSDRVYFWANDFTVRSVPRR